MGVVWLLIQNLGEGVRDGSHYILTFSISLIYTYCLLSFGLGFGGFDERASYPLR